MRTHFAQVFWGLLLVIIDIVINGFDIFVDGIGYLVVAAGCAGLSSLSKRFLEARVLCLMLAVLWLIKLVVSGDLAVVFGYITIAVNCMMIWQLLGGIMEFATQKQRPDLAARAENRRMLYVAIKVGSSLLPLVLSSQGDAFLLMIVLVISMFVLVIMILHLIHRVKNELAT